MVEYPLPTTKKELRSFLGMTGYYRKFIDNFAKIAAPLTDCTKKGEPNKIHWTSESVSAFKELKTAMTSSPVLIMPDFTKQFLLQSDASDFAIGAVLSQNTENESILLLTLAERFYLENETIR